MPLPIASRAGITDVVSTGLAIGAIFLLVMLAILVLLALGALVSGTVREILTDARDALAGKELWLIFALTALATAGSLFFSEVSLYVPCRLCWYQRIFMYPLAVIFLGMAIRRDWRGAFWYGIWLPIIGSGVSIYHLYIEAHPEAELAGCKIGAPCSTKWIDEFGFVTIPLLALSVSLSVIALLLLLWSRRATFDAPGGDGPGDDPDRDDPAAAAGRPEVAAA